MGSFDISAVNDLITAVVGALLALFGVWANRKYKASQLENQQQVNKNLVFDRMDKLTENYQERSKEQTEENIRLRAEIKCLEDKIDTLIKELRETNEKHWREKQEFLSEFEIISEEKRALRRENAILTDKVQALEKRVTDLGNSYRETVKLGRRSTDIIYMPPTIKEGEIISASESDSNIEE